MSSDHEAWDLDNYIVLARDLLSEGYTVEDLENMSLTSAIQLQQEIAPATVTYEDRGDCKYVEGTVDPACDGQEDTISLETIPAGSGYCMTHHCFSVGSVRQLIRSEDTTLNDARNPISRTLMTPRERAAAFQGLFTFGP